MRKTKLEDRIGRNELAERLEKATDLFRSYDPNATPGEEPEVALADGEKKKRKKKVLLTAEQKRKRSLQIIDAVFDIIADELVAVPTVEEYTGAGTVVVTGFGTFTTVDRPERTGPDRLNGGTWTKPAGRSVRFRSSKLLGERLNQNT